MRTIRRLLGFIKKQWHWLLISVLCIMVRTALAVAMPQFQRLVIDQCLEKKHWELLPYLSLAVVGACAVKSAFQFSQTYLSELLSQRIIFDIRNRLFDHIQRLSFSYHDQAETGQLISRATSDVDMLRQFFGEGLTYMIQNALMLVGVLAVCLVMSWRLTLVSLAIMPFVVLCVYKLRVSTRPLSMAVQDQLGHMTSTIQQNLMGIRVVKAFAREDYETRMFDKQAHELMDRSIKVSWLSADYQPAIDCLAFLGVALIVSYGGIQVMQHHLTVGSLVAFYTYIGLLVRPIRVLGWAVNIVQYAVVSAERIFEVLDTNRETHLKDGTVELKCCHGAVEFKDLSFSYANGARILNSLSLKVQPGEMLALVGATGSGKSTVINLLPRFYDVTEGALLIDGEDIRKYRLSSLRQKIGIVSQETFLFGDTIRENIAYGKPGAQMEEVIQAAKSANIHDFIMSLEDEYDTKIGERGVNLSGGQKQRVAIARAVLMNPPILIFDDSTSSVDMETEALIQKALVNLTVSRTTFVVAQRLSTIKRADKIVVLDKGRIVECGTHDELLARDGKYSEIYQMQFKGQEISDLDGSILPADGEVL